LVEAYLFCFLNVDMKKKTKQFEQYLYHEIEDEDAARK
jgi:hypothetical protein